MFCTFWSRTSSPPTWVLYAGGVHGYLDYPIAKLSQDACIDWGRPQLEADRVDPGMNLPHSLNRWECEPNVQQ